MTNPTNILQNVQTYQKSGLALLLNESPLIATLNSKFKNFETEPANLGDTVTFNKPVRYVATDGLVANFQATDQPRVTLTVDQSKNVSRAFTAQQKIFNVDAFLDEFGESAIATLGTVIERNVGQQIISSPYRFYGDGVTNLTTYGQLANMIALFKNYGTAKGPLKCYLPDVTIPNIVNSGLSQFVLERNNETAMSWELGRWNNVDFYVSSLLPTQVAGNCGNLNQTLTVVSTNDPSGANITQITFSGATDGDNYAINVNDLIQFQDGVSGKPNMRYMQWIGGGLSFNPVQLRATAPAGANISGDVTINFYPPLCAQPGNPQQNIYYNVVAGMQVKVMPTHVSGVITSGNAYYLAMPQLPDKSPFYSGNEIDPGTGVSIRLSYGSMFEDNKYGYINDAIWGSKLVEEYGMQIILPL